MPPTHMSGIEVVSLTLDFLRLASGLPLLERLSLSLIPSIRGRVDDWGGRKEIEKEKRRKRKVRFCCHRLLILSSRSLPLSFSLHAHAQKTDEM